MCAKTLDGASTSDELSLVGKSLTVRLVDCGHLFDRKSEAIDDSADVIDLIECEGPSLPGLQILVEHLIAADPEVPHILGHRLEELCLVNPDCLFLGRIAQGLNRVVAIAMILSKARSRLLPQQMHLHQSPAELGKGMRGKSMLRNSA